MFGLPLYDAADFADRSGFSSEIADSRLAAQRAAQWQAICCTKFSQGIVVG
jgi:hypothetical protein